MSDTPNAAGEAQVAEAGKRDQQAKEQDADDLRWIMSTRPGRRFLGNLIYDPVRFLGGGCGIAQATFSQSHATMAAAEGARDISLRLLACVEAVDFNLALTIRQERHLDAQARATQIAERAKDDVSESPTLFAHDGPPV